MLFVLISMVAAARQVTSDFDGSANSCDTDLCIY